MASASTFACYSQIEGMEAIAGIQYPRAPDLHKLGSFLQIPLPPEGQASPADFAAGAIRKWVRFRRSMRRFALRAKLASFPQFPFLRKRKRLLQMPPPAPPKLGSFFHSFLCRRISAHPTPIGFVSSFPRFIEHAARSPLPIGFVSGKPHSRVCYNDSFRPDIAGSRYVP